MHTTTDFINWIDKRVKGLNHHNLFINEKHPVVSGHNFLDECSGQLKSRLQPKSVIYGILDHLIAKQIYITNPYGNVGTTVNVLFDMRRNSGKDYQFKTWGDNNRITLFSKNFSGNSSLRVFGNKGILHSSVNVNEPRVFAKGKAKMSFDELGNLLFKVKGDSTNFKYKIDFSDLKNSIETMPSIILLKVNGEPFNQFTIQRYWVLREIDFNDFINLVEDNECEMNIRLSSGIDHGNAFKVHAQTLIKELAINCSRRTV